MAVGDRRLATRSLTRQWLGDGVKVRTLRTDTDQVAGVLALPPAGSSPRVAVLAIGGSGGGVGMAADAALLASHGYPALALAYFHHPGRPDQLQDIPLEYFAAPRGAWPPSPAWGVAAWPPLATRAAPSRRCWSAPTSPS